MRSMTVSAVWRHDQQVPQPMLRRARQSGFGRPA